MTFIILLFFFISFFSKNPMTDYFGLIGVFLFASMRITPLAYNIFSSLSQIYSSRYSLETIYDEFQEIDSYKKKIKINYDKNNLINIEQFKSLSFKNVSFDYGNDNNILNNINFFIQKGECIGIRGDSGSGKTTLINLMLGLLYPSKGEIIINDKVPALQTNIHKIMSYTPQDSFLINGNILENIALGSEMKDIKKEKIFKILKTTRLDESLNVNDKNFIDILLSRKIDTLSGGQAQRIAICRNLYFNREINVFDEFTSSLDIKTENKIIEFLNTLKRKHTILIISHRMNALKYCDRIYEVENRKLVEK